LLTFVKIQNAITSQRLNGFSKIKKQQNALRDENMVNNARLRLLAKTAGSAKFLAKNAKFPF